jgi:hypothetical protein
VAYDKNNTTQGPSAAAGQPNATAAAASSIRASTWPYQRYEDLSLPPPILLRPPTPPPAIDDPTVDAITALQNVMQAVQRGVRLISAPWLVFPPDGESFHQAAGIVIPAITVGVYTVVVQIICPPGRNGVINQIANEYIGAGFTDYGGAIIWQILRNPGPGITAAERNYQAITASLGTTVAPTKIAPIRIFENDVIQLVVTNVAVVPAGQIIAGLFGGYFYPRTWDDQFEATDMTNAW